MLALFLVACLAVQDDAAATEAVTTFDSTISKTKDPSTKVAALGKMASVHHEKVVSRLAAVLTHDDKSLKVSAAQALATMKDTPELTRGAAHALGSALSAGSNQKEIEVQVAIFGAIGKLQEESSASLLKSHFDDKEVQTAQAAITAAGELKSKSLIEPLIDNLRDCEKKAQPPSNSGNSRPGKPVRAPKGGGGSGSSGDTTMDPEMQKQQRATNLIPTLLGALSTATGQNFPTAAEWEKWWSKNHASFTPSK